MQKITQPRQIGEHRERIGKTVFIIRSFDNPATAETSEKLILKLMESKIRNIQTERQVQPA